jgi:hydroxyethylthiazole kinase-like uncharacterized protein yjeF
MIPVLSREQSRAFDHAAIEVARVPSVVLMENAGRGVVDAIVAHWSDRPLRDTRVVIVCGLGNNGGDGFVVARHLLARGASVDVFVAGDPAKLKGDARVHFDAMQGLGLVASTASNDLSALNAALGHATLIVDALFGTGLSRPIEGHDAALIAALTAAHKPVVSVDVPSGLDADTGATLGVAVHADLTVTFAARKRGSMTPSGSRLTGNLVVADIGVPGPKVTPGPAQARLLERRDVARLFAPRASGMHKNGAGHVLVIAGSPGHLGAAVMCAHGAFRAGAGLVTVATWPEAADALDGRTVEVMTARLDAKDVVGSVDSLLRRAKVIVMGPGFGKDDRAREVVRHVLTTWRGPLVVDADALAMFSNDAEVFASAKGQLVLTPHPGELATLLGSTAKDIEHDRFVALSKAVERGRSVTVLKGEHTLIGSPDEAPVINGSGTSALATAGSGDILSGTIGALACTLSPFEAAYAGVHLHGLAAEAWSQSHGDRGLLAHEIADEYPGVIARLVAEGTR